MLAKKISNSFNKKKFKPHEEKARFIYKGKRMEAHWKTKAAEEPAKSTATH